MDESSSEEYKRVSEVMLQTSDYQGGLCFSVSWERFDPKGTEFTAAIAKIPFGQILWLFLLF